jgi:hypothetical protein
MRSIQVNLQNGSNYKTNANGTNEEIERYFVGQVLDMNPDPEAEKQEYFLKCTSIDFLD